MSYSDRHPGNERASIAACLLAALLAGSGCVLPFGSAAPQPPTTVGKEEFRIGGRIELPTVDLLETEEEGGDSVELTPFPVASFELGYGVHELVDLEVGFDVAVYFVVPVPLGGFGGFRVQVVESDDLAIAAAARIGYVGISSDDDDEMPLDGRSVSAVYGTGNITAQANPKGWLSPGLALAYTGASVEDDPDDGPANRVFTNLATATAYLDLTEGPTHFGPFVNVVLLDNRAVEPKVLVTGGVFFYGRFGGSSDP